MATTTTTTTPTKQQRHSPTAEGEPEAKRSRLPGSLDSAGGHRRVVLNPADCDLDFSIDGNGLQGHALHEEGFAYCWSGARATVGITGGKYCFGCRIISEQKVQMEDTAPDQRHLCRLGISRGDDPVGSLGESDHSFGFGVTGKFSAAGNFLDYGATFGVGDTIICAVNLENKPLASIGYSLNGKWLGSAKQFDAGPKGLGVLNSVPSKLSWGSALFPHILLKNVVVQMQFSIEDGLIPEEGYKPWSSALEGGHAVIGPSFAALKECEVVMMVGLPASGKTTWAEKWLKDHPEKRYVLLGTNLALEHMKVPGVLSKRNYGGRSDLMDRATQIFNTLLSRACKTPHNYIIDQTNVYKSARKRILHPFVHFRKIAVVVFPTLDELKCRLKSRAERQLNDMGKEVPAKPVNEMLAHYVLPVSKDMPCADECFDEVTFPELDRSEAQKYLDKIKCVLRSASNLSGRTNFPSFNPLSSVTGKVDSVPGGFGQRNLCSQKDNHQFPVLEVDMSRVYSLTRGSQGCPVVGSTKSPQQTEGEIIQHAATVSLPTCPVSPLCGRYQPPKFPVSPVTRRYRGLRRQGSFEQVRPTFPCASQTDEEDEVGTRFTQASKEEDEDEEGTYSNQASKEDEEDTCATQASTPAEDEDVNSQESIEEAPPHISDPNVEETGPSLPPRVEVAAPNHSLGDTNLAPSGTLAQIDLCGQAVRINLSGQVAKDKTVKWTAPLEKVSQGGSNALRQETSVILPGTGVEGHNKPVPSSTDVFPEHGIDWPDSRQAVVPFVGAKEMLDTLIAGVLTLFQRDQVLPPVEAVRSALRSGTRAYRSLGLPRDPWMTAVGSTWEEFRRAHAASRLKIQRLVDEISALSGEARELHSKAEDARGRRSDLEAKQAADRERIRRFYEAARKLAAAVESTAKVVQQLQAEEAAFVQKDSDLQREIASKRAQVEELKRENPHVVYIS